MKMGVLCEHHQIFTYIPAIPDEAHDLCIAFSGLLFLLHPNCSGL